MFQNAALDVAIGLVLMYLVLSLVCTVVNEFIASQLRLRSRSLAAGLREIIDDPVVRNAFYSHGLIAGTKGAIQRATPLKPDPSTPAPQPVDVHPSYIAAETFVLALIGSLGAAPAPGTTIPGITEIAAVVSQLPTSKMKDSLEASLIAAQGNLSAFRQSAAKWFDDSMDRLSGAYKRNLKFISIAVGCLVASLINADSLVVGRALWSDAGLRAQIVQAANVTAAANPTSATSALQPVANAAASRSVSDVIESLAKAERELRPLPMGWSLCPKNTGDNAKAVTRGGSISPCIPDAAEPGLLLFLLLKLSGLFVTALALSLGAPFWFDTLSKFMNIRGAGAKPARADE
jgi:hypothetical protein